MSLLLQAGASCPLREVMHGASARNAVHWTVVGSCARCEWQCTRLLLEMPCIGSRARTSQCSSQPHRDFEPKGLFSALHGLLDSAILSHSMTALLFKWSS